MMLRIPDAVLMMNRTDALAYYREQLHLSEADARALVAETHSGAFRDLTPADDDRTRIAVEVARYPKQSQPSRSVQRSHDAVTTDEAPKPRVRATAHGREA